MPNPPRRSWLTLGLLALAVLIPAGLFVGLPRVRPAGAAPNPVDVASRFPPSTLPLRQSQLGPAPGYRPLITNVQIVDLDQDGIPDVLACDARRNRVIWYRQAPRGQWTEHVLGDRDLAAPCHATVVDLNGDGKLDVIALISQEDEEVWAFENLGGGRFRKRVLLSHLNFDLGSAGLVLTDLDKDGRPDLLLVAGDNLEIRYPAPQRWHGCFWLRNLGDWKWKSKRIATLGGTYAAGVGDLNGDGRADVVLVSMFNDFRRPGAASVVWLENDGKQNSRAWQIADAPTNLATVAVGDLNGDGRADVVAGGLHLLEPFDRLGRLTVWLSERGGP